jgi:putative transposase
LIEAGTGGLSLRRQCALLGLNRSSWYYKGSEESKENLRLMRKIDEQFTKAPFYGQRRMTEWLKSQGEYVNHKRVGRLMREMGLEAIYPKPRLSQGGEGHRIYPYLLKGLTVERPNQVWGTDITYIRLAQGFIYLVAIMDWFSRYVVSWAVSVTLDVAFCVEALEEALSVGQPEIFNSDQGAQFTSMDFTKKLKGENIRISMDGRGRVFDNIFVERLWRSVKYEEVYLKDYSDVSMARAGLADYFRFYNQERLHQSLDYKTPASIYQAA